MELPIFGHNNCRILLKGVEPSTTNQNMTNNVRVPAGTVVAIDNGCPIVATINGFVKLTQLEVPRFRRFRFAVGQILS
jgi:DNA-binding transcriptional regulator YdaS (Cro superfamily)